MGWERGKGTVTQDTGCRMGNGMGNGTQEVGWDGDEDEDEDVEQHAGEWDCDGEWDADAGRRIRA